MRLSRRTLGSLMFRSNPKIQLDDKTGLGFNVRSGKDGL